MAAVLAAAALAVIPAIPGHALTYQYLAGHPMYIDKATCTGGYTVVGTSGMFTLSAGHCGWPGKVVKGTSAAFGTVAYSKGPSRLGDSPLVSMYGGVTQHQIIVDPLTGLTPGGDGKVVGVMPSSQQVVSARVGKMGVSTGWTEGEILGTASYYGDVVVCTTAKTRAGDSGGPVWRADQYGLRAVGMIVASDDRTGTGCYEPLDRVLQGWGATLRTYGLTRESTPVEGDLSLDHLPALDPSQYHLVPAGG